MYNRAGCGTIYGIPCSRYRSTTSGRTPVTNDGPTWDGGGGASLTTGFHTASSARSISLCSSTVQLRQSAFTDGISDSGRSGSSRTASGFVASFQSSGRPSPIIDIRHARSTLSALSSSAAVRLKSSSPPSQTDDLLKRTTSHHSKPESTERSGEGAGTGHHRDGEGADPADMGRAGPTVACCR